MIRYRISLGLLLGMVFTIALQSGPANADGRAIPPELQRWQSWVLDGHEERLCPGTFNDGAAKRCRWPSRLEIHAGADGGLGEGDVGRVQQEHPAGPEEAVDAGQHRGGEQARPRARPRRGTSPGRRARRRPPRLRCWPVPSRIFSPNISTPMDTTICF